MLFNPHLQDRKSLKIRVVTFVLHILGVYLFYYYTKKHMKCEDNGKIEFRALMVYGASKRNQASFNASAACTLSTLHVSAAYHFRIPLTMMSKIKET